MVQGKPPSPVGTIKTKHFWRSLKAFAKQSKNSSSIEAVHSKESKTMEIAPYITVDSAIHHGTPIITGTRVPAEIVVASLAGGMSKAEVMAKYGLTQVQIEAALSYNTASN
jgi:uncharacterized protein (DUF433 family)